MDADTTLGRTVLFKQGLDHRLNAFQEQKRRIDDVQFRLNQRFDAKLVDGILSFEHDLHTYAKPIRDLLKQQTQKLSHGSKTLAQEKFQRDILKDETMRLRKIFQQLPVRDGLDDSGFKAPGTDPAILSLDAVDEELAFRMGVPPPVRKTKPVPRHEMERDVKLRAENDAERRERARLRGAEEREALEKLRSEKSGTFR